MKKLLVATLLTTASFGAFAYDAQVNFTGLVQDQTCQVNGQLGQAIMNVTLPTVNKSALSTAESWAGNMPFKFDLTNCPLAATSAKWEVTSLVDATADGSLKNTVAGTDATLRLLNAEGNPININTDLGYAFTPAADGSYTLNYTAQYFSKNGGASAGQLKTVGYVTLTY